MNGPVLRFQEFKDLWKSSMLGNYLEEYSNITSGASNIPIATSSRKGLFLQNEYFNGERSYETGNVKYKIVPRGFATYRHMSDDSTFHFNINSIREKVLVSSEYPVFNTKVTANLYYIVEYLNHAPSFKKFCMTQKLGGTRTRLYYKNLQRFQIRIPSFKEQQKIADFFTLLDQRIEKQYTKVELLKLQKKGLMQKIFSQELRFKDENGKEYPGWEEMTLDNISTIEKGTQINRAELDQKSFGKKYPVYNGGITTSGYHIKYNREPNSIIISEGGNSCGYVNFIKEYFWSGGHSYTITPTDNLVYKQYLFQILKENEQKIMALRVGSGLPNIQKTALQKYKLFLSCSLDEQRKIADLLYNFDKRIEKEEEKAILLVNQKKGFMQQMFF